MVNEIFLGVFLLSLVTRTMRDLYGGLVYALILYAILWKDTHIHPYLHRRAQRKRYRMKRDMYRYDKRWWKYGDLNAQQKAIRLQKQLQE